MPCIAKLAIHSAISGDRLIYTDITPNIIHEVCSILAYSFYLAFLYLLGGGGDLGGGLDQLLDSLHRLLEPRALLSG